MTQGFYLGLMSGTSLDGVDAVLADLSAAQPRVLACASLPYADALRAEILALQPVGDNELDRAARLAQQLARLYAEVCQLALAQAGVSAAQVVAVGCHGQTVRHAPQAGYTVQLADLALLAELTGIDVVGDFRRRDLAAGGQGAPLVPAAHQAWFGDAHEARVVLNLGGIGNLTRLDPALPVIGFDTGPGNMLMDAWIADCQPGARFDAGGAWAASGRCVPALLADCLADPYFAAPPPKSTGREQFRMDWVTARLGGGESPADVQATLLELTAATVAGALQAHQPGTARVIACGGGVRNPLLMARIAALLPGMRIDSTADHGLDPDYVEAMAFAWLARETLAGRPGNLPAGTGVRGPRVLGVIHPA